jgi:glycosyltransferase involved in cell wall biosynthesis
MLTVLHVLEAFEAGCARHVTDLVTHVAGVRHVVVVPPRRVGGRTEADSVARLTDAGGRVHVIPMRRFPVHPHNATAVVRIRRLIAAERPHVVHGHASIGGALARAASRRTGAKVVWTPNGVLTSAAVLAVERALAPLTDAVVAVSPSEADLLLRLRLATPDQVAMIRNGIDLDPRPAPVDLRSMLQIPPHAPLVGMVGRLAPQKAPLDFVDVARRVAEARPDVHFVLIGDGRLAPAVDAAAAAWDRGRRFHRVPALPQAGRVLGQLDVFVLTSRYEGGPYAPLEAMREGVPVVLTDVVGSRDLKPVGRTGLLVQPGDTALTASLVTKLLAEEGLASDIANRNREWVVHHGDVRHMATAHLRLYERLACSHDRFGGSGADAGAPEESV